jgi:DNA-binding transcriptional ArsR family regulator
VTGRSGAFDPLSEGAPSTALVEAGRGDDGSTPAVATELLSARDPRRTNLVVVLYDAVPDEWLTAWLQQVGTRPADLHVVSVGESTRSGSGAAAHSPPPGSPSGNATIRTVEDPGNVTELGITINECLTEDGDGERTALCFDSVSALLQWTSLEYAVQFLGILAGRLGRNDRTGVFVVRPDAHDERTRRALESALGTVVTDGNDHGGDAESTDTVLEALSDPRRRDALRILLVERSSTVEELATGLVRDRPSDADRTTVSKEELATELYHWHLPQLANTGFVEYDAESGTVELADSAHRLRPYLRMTQSE